MHGFVVYVKEVLPFAWDIFLKKGGFLHMVLTGFTSFSNLLLFPLLIIFSSAIIVLIGMVFVIDALRDAPLEDIFKPSASAAAS